MGRGRREKWTTRRGRGGGEEARWRGGEVERWRELEGEKTDRWTRWRDGALYLSSTIRWRGSEGNPRSGRVGRENECIKQNKKKIFQFKKVIPSRVDF